MNLKKINSLILLIIISIFLSFCSSKSNIEIIDNNILEQKDFIKESNSNIQNEIIDFYQDYYNFNLQQSSKFKKFYNFSVGKNFDDSSLNPSNVILFDDHLYYVDNKANFIKINLLKKNKIFEISLKDKVNNLIMPTSLIKNNNIFYIGFGNGDIIKIDENGEKYWEKSFNDLLRTPIKFLNDSIIILFNSNKIVSINTNNGELIWEYNLSLNKPSLSKGGNLLNKYNFVYFIMPNGRIGSIDTIIGELAENPFLAKIMQKNILNYNYEIKFHIYEDFLIFLEDNNTIFTYDLINEKYLLFNNKIHLSKSSYFVNNSLIVLQNNYILKVYNLSNKNLFWNIDLSKYLSKDDTIVASYVINETLLIFFSSGKIIQLNKYNGDELFRQDLNLTEVNNVSLRDNYFIISQSNGKVFLYKQ